MENLEDDCMFTLMFENRKIYVNDWDRRRPGYLWDKVEFSFDGTRDSLKVELLDILENKLPNVNKLGWSKNCVDIMGLSTNIMTNSVLVFVCTSRKPV